MKRITILLSALVLFSNCNNSTIGHWSEGDKEKWMRHCTEQSEIQQLEGSIARNYCKCILDKLEYKYRNFNEMNTKGTSKEGRDLGIECQDELVSGNTDDETNVGEIGDWTQAQFKQYVLGCTSSAQKAQGMTADQAKSYCECMTRKVAQQFSFDIAANMTTADFQTDEWMNTAKECKDNAMDQ